MRRGISSFFVVVGVALIVVASGAAPNDATLFGFSAANSSAQRALEKNFDSQLNATELRDWLKQLSSAANHVGAPHN
ncbi:MAG TPA: hypothetical protein VET48_03175 [Steroidobacteraceae bacterium]|nr:hypothetical protein [Steroidobacteraceae bacterium]